MASPAHSKIFIALRALQKEPFDMSKSPRELFAPHEVYGPATQDRAIALVGATNIDMTLEHAIKTHLVQLNSRENQELFGPDAPIGSFSARIKMGYAIGIYGRKFRDDLDRIRYIRNTFAHVQKHLDFTTPEIVAACNEIRIVEEGNWGIFGKPVVDAKAQYIWSAMKFCWHLFFSPDNKLIKLSDSEIYSADHGP